jgi:TetR/AcrR family transcriptional regulator
MPARSASPRRRNGDTREHLLNTAIELFSAGGYDGASVNDIVARAGVNKRMVYHYWQNKARLYQEALHFAFSELAARENAAVAEAQDLESAVKNLVRVYFEFPRQHPQYSRLLRWENLNEGRHIHDAPTPLSKDHVTRFLRAAIKREADGKRWRADLEANQLLITIIGICQVYVSHRYTLSQGLRRNLGSPAAIKRGITNAEHYLIAGMRPAKAGRSSKR